MSPYETASRKWFQVAMIRMVHPSACQWLPPQCVAPCHQSWLWAHLLPWPVRVHVAISCCAAKTPHATDWHSPVGRFVLSLIRVRGPIAPSCLIPLRRALPIYLPCSCDPPPPFPGHPRTFVKVALFPTVCREVLGGQLTARQLNGKSCLSSHQRV